MFLWNWPFISLYGQVRVIYTYQNVALRQHKSISVGGSLVIIRIQKLIQDDGDGDGDGEG